MANLADLIVKIGANISGFDSAMGDVSKLVGKTVSDAEKSFRGFDKLGGNLKNLGTTITAAITLPIAGVGIATTKMAADFELGLRKVGSLVGGFSDHELKNLESQTLAVSKAMGIDAVKATDALYQAISAGVPKENALSFVEVASKAAIAGITDTNVAVDALTTIIAAYGLETKDAKDVSDAMFQAVNIGKFEFKDLAAAIGPAAQQAKNLGISYTELLAATSTLSLTSGGVSNAVTQIESAMRSLLKPTSEMDKALEQIGFKTGQAAVASLGFEGTLEALHKTTGDSAAAYNALFGRIEGATGALGLVGDKAKTAAEHLDTMRHSTDGAGAAAKAYDEINKSSSRQFDILVNNLKSTAIEMGLSLLPAVNTLLKASQPFMQFIEGMVKAFSNLPAPIQATVLVLTAAAAAAGPLIFITGQLISSFATVATAIKAVTGVIGLAGSGGLLGALGSGAGLAGLLAIAEPLAIAFGVAIAGWVIYKAVSDMQALNKELNAFQDAADRGVKATPQQAQQIGILTDALKHYNEEASLAGKQQIQIPKLDLNVANPINAYVAALKAAAAAVPTVNDTLKSLGGTFDDIKKAGGTLDLSKTVEAFSGSERAAAALKATLDTLRTTGTFDLGKTLGLSSLQQALGGLSIAAQKIIEDQDKANKELADARAVYTELSKAAATGGASQLAVAAAAEKVQQALQKANPELVKANKEIADLGTKAKDILKDLPKTFADFEDSLSQVSKDTPAVKQMVELVSDAEANWKKLPPAVQGYIAALKQAIDQQRTFALFEELGKSEAKLMQVENDLQAFFAKAYNEYTKQATAAGSKAIEIVIPLEQRLPKAFVDAANAMAQLKAEFSKFGIVSLDALVSSRDELQRTIALAEQRNASEYELSQLREKELETELRIAVIQGKSPQDISQIRAEWNAAANEVNRFYVDLTHVPDLAERITNSVHKLKGELDGIFHNFTGGVIDKIIGLFHGNSQNDQLDKDAADLKTNLSEQTSAWEQYQKDVAAQMAALPDQYKKSLDSEIASLEDSLKKQRADYDQFFSDKTLAYDRSVADIKEKIGEVTAANAEDLQHDLDQLNQQLSDKTEAYQQYVEDVNTKLQRIGENTAQDIKDETTKTKRGIADKQKAYDREEQDTQKRIDDLTAANKAGWQQQVADLKLALKRKKEDLDTYTQRATDDLQTYTDEHNAQAKQQTADLNLELARRTSDYRDYVQQNAAQVVQVTADHKAALDQQLADLQTKLQRETEDYDAAIAEKKAALAQFVIDTAAKEDQARAETAAKLALELSDLQKNLDEKQKEYDDYKNGIGAKLEEIKSKHVTIWGEIYNLLAGQGGIFDQIGSAFLKAIVDPLTQPLSDAIGGIFSRLSEKVSGWLGDIFGRIPGVGGIATPPISTTSGIPGTGGNPIGGGGGSGGDAGSAGSAAGGLAGLITAIASVGSLISNIIGNFQNARQENTLNAIEQNTRDSAFYLGGDNSGGGILHQVYLTNELLSWGPIVKAVEAIKDRLSGGALGGGSVGLDSTALGLLGDIKDAVLYGFATKDLDVIKDTILAIKDLLTNGIMVNGGGAGTTPPTTEPGGGTTTPSLPSAPGGSRTDTAQQLAAYQAALAYYNLFGQVGNPPHDFGQVIAPPIDPTPMAPPPPTEIYNAGAWAGDSMLKPIYSNPRSMRGSVYLDSRELFSSFVQWGEDRGLIIPQG